MTHGLRDRVRPSIRRRRRLHYFLRNLFFAPAERREAILARRASAPCTLPIVMIVGCSRSGTSFAARMLKSAGLLLPGEHTPPDEFNPEGYFEEDRVVAVNSDILWGSGGHWFMPPPRLRVYAYQRAQIVQALTWFCSFGGIAGWKDPRGTLTLPVWLEMARELEIPVCVVGVFRNPAAVAASIVRHERGAIEFPQALSAWCVHNARLLDLAASQPSRFSWFTTDQCEQRVEKNLNALAGRLGLGGRVAMDDNHRRTIVPNLLEIPAMVREIHERLLAAHAAQWGPTNRHAHNSAAS